MFPSTQGLESFNSASRQSNDWLVLKVELMTLDSLTQITFKCQPGRSNCLHLRIKNAIATSAASLGVVHSRVRFADCIGS